MCLGTFVCVNHVYYKHPLAVHLLSSALLFQTKHNSVAEAPAHNDYSLCYNVCSLGQHIRSVVTSAIVQSRHVTDGPWDSFSAFGRQMLTFMAIYSVHGVPMVNYGPMRQRRRRISWRVYCPAPFIESMALRADGRAGMMETTLFVNCEDCCLCADY